METRAGVTEMPGADDAFSAMAPASKRKTKERTKTLRAAEPIEAMIPGSYRQFHYRALAGKKAGGKKNRAATESMRGGTRIMKIRRRLILMIRRRNYRRRIHNLPV
jgi:hypothetical protein